jgi:Cu-Zn family superoxide dismutase
MLAVARVTRYHDAEMGEDIMRIAIAAALLAAAAGIAGAQAPVGQVAPPPSSAPAGKTAMLMGVGGKAIGTVTLTDAPTGVLLRVEASGLAPGWHGIHFHEKGDCSDAAFKMAGGHVHSMTPVVHGLLHQGANDQGDLTNVYAGADGKVNAEIFSTMASLHAAPGFANLLDADGSAVVIHASADDYTTQPIGGAGARVACAVVK